MKKLVLYARLALILSTAIILIIVSGNCAATEGSNPALPATGKLLFKDDFNTSNSGWSRQTTEELQRDYSNGEYYIKLNKFNLMYWVWNTDAGVFNDFILNMDARLVSGVSSNFYGSIFRYRDDDNFYCFMVRCDGNFYIGKRFNGEATDLKDWTKASSIKKGTETNRLKIVCQGSQIALCVNDQYLVTVKDSSFSNGHVGIIAGAPQSPTVHVAFDNLQIFSIR
jgi:hypothetical protein